MGKDDLLKRHGRSERPFVPAQEEVRQRLDVSCPPPAMQRRIGSRVIATARLRAWSSASVMPSPMTNSL